MRHKERRENPFMGHAVFADGDSRCWLDADAWRRCQAWSPVRGVRVSAADRETRHTTNYGYLAERRTADPLPATTGCWRTGTRCMAAPRTLSELGPRNRARAGCARPFERDAVVAPVCLPGHGAAPETQRRRGDGETATRVDLDASSRRARSERPPVPAAAVAAADGAHSV